MFLTFLINTLDFNVRQKDSLISQSIFIHFGNCKAVYEARVKQFLWQNGPNLAYFLSLSNGTVFLNTSDRYFSNTEVI